MTNFEQKLKELITKEFEIKDLWEQSVRQARRELEDEWDLLETAKSIFIDSIIDAVYGWVEDYIPDEEVRDLLTQAIEDADFDDIINSIIIEKQLEI